MTYRPDIDGLRAVAVIAVILFHLNANWLPGGFLGVDIFFVISGYLIGGILYRELSTGTFSLKRFYLRRMRRILPAFFAVVVFTLIVGAQLMVPGSDEWNTARSSAKWSVFFGGNFFSALNTDYFAPTVEVQPLNHLWSLAVEEQFYFIYPLILWAIMGIIKRILPPASSSLTRCVNVVLTALAIASFALAFLPISLHGTALVPYYLPHLRFGELLIGAILAVAVAQGNLQPSAKTATFVGSLSILVLIACLVLPFPNTTPWFPGFAAALPCIASAGIIYAGARPYWFASALSHRAVVFVGKISYSLYLWHWPLLAFAHYALGRRAQQYSTCRCCPPHCSAKPCFLLSHRTAPSPPPMVVWPHRLGLLSLAYAPCGWTLHAGAKNANRNGTICELRCPKRNRESFNLHYHRQAK